MPGFHLLKPPHNNTISMNDKNDKSSWKRMSFKKNKVWASADKNGNLIIENGKVLIKYNLKQDYEYKVKADNLEPENLAVPSKKQKNSAKPKGKSSPKKQQSSKSILAEDNRNLPPNCIKIYTDGASSGNPGPSGIGALLLYGDKQKEISEYIGHSTNNIAELTAIKAALKELKRYDLPVRIFSDSSYSIGLLTQGWKPKKNQKLVSEIKDLIKKFSDLNFIKVKGHAGIKENEIADFLATSAIKKGQE